MATDLADYLVRKRVTFRAAHAAVGQLVREAEEQGCELHDLPFASFESAHVAFKSDVLGELRPSSSLAHREVDGGTGPKSVRRQMEAAKAALRGDRKSGAAGPTDAMGSLRKHMARKLI